MIRNEDIIRIGHISRTHGVKGEVEVQFTDDPFDRGEAEYLVLDRDGINVPFFFTEYRYKGRSSALFTFEDVTTEEAARRLVGATVSYPRDAAPAALPDFEDAGSLRALTGFRLYAVDPEESTEDELATYDLGDITYVDESSMNTLVTAVDDEGDERILPLHTDFIVEIDPEDRSILIDIPLELLDLND